MFISPPAESPAVADLYESSRKDLGYVMNYNRAWAWRPDIAGDFAGLRSKLMAGSSLSKRDIAVLVCATAASLGDSYCALAWGRTLANAADADQAASVIRAASDRPEDPALAAREQALARWARKVVSDPVAIEATEVDSLKAVGLTEQEIFEATALIGFRLAFSTVNNALGVPPDPQVEAAAPPEVRRAVRFGRSPATVGAGAAPQA